MVKIFFALLALALCASTYAFYYSLVDDDATNDAALEQAVSAMDTEEVWCSVTVPVTCRLYRCNSGYIYFPAISPPGAIPLKCSDDSLLEAIREVTGSDYQPG